MLDFTFTKEQYNLRDRVRKFVNTEIKPIAAKIDREEKIPAELIKKIGELSLLGLPFPEKYGGGGAGEIGYCLMLEELARGCASTATFVGAHVSLGSMAIYLEGSEKQKKKYLTPLAQGKKIAAFALTEPEAGCDAANIKTQAVLHRKEYVLNGKKIFIANGDIADIIIVFAVTDKRLRSQGGISAFIVEKSFKGFKIGKKQEKMGICGSSTCELIFKNMRVPKENLLGKVGLGFITAMKTLDVGRLSLGAACLGAAKEALDLSTKYSKDRLQFGKPICEQEAIQWMLAEMAAEIFAMESMVYRAAWMCDQKMKFSREAAISKMFCSEALDRIVDKAVQIHGGRGYLRDYPLERFYRDARINRIFEGTNEVQRMVIARDIIKKSGY